MNVSMGVQCQNDFICGKCVVALTLSVEDLSLTTGESGLETPQWNPEFQELPGMLPQLHLYPYA